MSQVATNQLPTTGTLGGLAFVNLMNPMLLALFSQNKGATAPDNPVEGMVWCDDSAGAIWSFKVYDGDQWVKFMELNSTTHTIDMSFAVKDATTAIKGVVEKALASEMTAGTANKFPDATVIKNWLIGENHTFTKGQGVGSYEIGLAVSGTVAVDIENGNKQHMTMTGAVTLEAPTNGFESWVDIEITVGGAGGFPFVYTGFEAEVVGTFDDTAGAVTIVQIDKSKNKTTIQFRKAA